MSIKKKQKYPRVINSPNLQTGRGTRMYIPSS